MADTQKYKADEGTSQRVSFVTSDERLAPRCLEDHVSNHRCDSPRESITRFSLSGNNFHKELST